MSLKILDKVGLEYFWTKLKAYFALDSAVVHLAGDETVTGAKTFSSVISGSTSGNFPLTGTYYSSGTYDFDDFTTSGVWTFAAATNLSHNPAGSNGMLVVFAGANNWVRQFWMRTGTPDSNEHQFYFRLKAGSWSAWKKIFTDKDVIPVANGGTGSATQNFVDLTTAQVIGGTKNFTSEPQWNGLDISGKSSNYCADCNAALTPGRYYIDENTLNSPDGTAGVLTVEGKGGPNDDVWQECITVRNSSAQALIVYRRKVIVSSGVFYDSWLWSGSTIIGRWPRQVLFRESGDHAVLCPPCARQLPAQPNSYYEFIRAYHTRDAARDNTYNSFGCIARFVQNTSPTSGNYVRNAFVFLSSEGGITSPEFLIQINSRCASNVTYTDNTSEVVYGEYLSAGDVRNGKTVASVTYKRESDDAVIYFEIDNIMRVGGAGNRMSTIYAGTGAIDTSDERLKRSIVSIPDAVLDAWGEVGWVQYQFKDAVEKKGEDARLHTGAVAQRIDAIFKSHGLDASRYGLFCYDVWEDEWDEDEEGVRHKVREAGDRYSLRYEEALAMEAAYQRRRADRLEARIAALEAKLR